MLHAILSNASFWHLLLQLDEDLAAETQAARCLHCGAVLHSARYPRKPRGVSRAVLGPEYEYRLSLCCSRDGCRRRATPPSVRFFSRRVYLGALVVLISALSQGLPGKRRARLRELVGVSERTVARWRRWWHEVFPATRLWCAMRGQFAAPVAPGALPGALLERFGNVEHSSTLASALTFLAPWSVCPEQAR